MFWAARALQWHVQRAPKKGYSPSLTATVTPSPCPVWDRLLQLLVLNQEFLVSVGHYSMPNTSLPFVHTARRCYRLGFAVTSSEAVGNGLDVFGGVSSLEYISME